MKFESPEAKKPSDERGEYLEKLRSHGLEVVEGLGIDRGSYAVNEGALNDTKFREVIIKNTEDALDMIIRYLNFPAIKDNFESHAERVEWFSENELGSDLYLENKFRLNKVNGADSCNEFVYHSMSLRGLKEPEIVKPLAELQKNFDAKHPRSEYGKTGLADTYEYVDAYIEYLKEFVNTMIDIGLVDGSKL